MARRILNLFSMSGLCLLLRNKGFIKIYGLPELSVSTRRQTREARLVSPGETSAGQTQSELVGTMNFAQAIFIQY